VSGRPLIALPGPVPAYRDLRPGASGPDITALQAALRGLGHKTGADTNGYFGAGTKAALTAFYNALGYPVATTGPADEEAVNGARSRVAAAERGLAAAREALEEARRRAAEPNPPSSGGGNPVADAERQLRIAEEDLPMARADLARIEARTGPMLPSREVVFLPEFPAQVVSLTARVGTVVSGEEPLVTLSSGALVAQTRVDPIQRELMKPGLDVQILSELRGVTVTGVISTIGNLEQDAKAGATHAVTIKPHRPFDPALSGVDVRLTVHAASTDGEVLVVPLAAVSAGADGRTSVVKVLPDRREERVDVVPGLSGDGYVEIRPAAGGSVAAGDRVVIGR
jgi:HlyD family secretion protein